MRVLIRCNSESCRLDLGIPIVVSAPWPSIDSVCQVCGSGVMVVEGIDQGVTINAASVSEAPTQLLDYSLLGVTPEEQLLLDGFEFFGHRNQGGNKVCCHSVYVHNNYSNNILVDLIPLLIKKFS